MLNLIIKYDELVFHLCSNHINVKFQLTEF